MNVSCPQCNHGYKLDESRIPDSGQRMRCPKCSCTFRVHSGGTITDVSASPASVPPAAARPSVAPKRPERKLRPSVLSEPPGPAPRKLEETDLPAPLADADLPAPKAGRGIFDEIDLPTPAAMDLRASKTGHAFGDELDLPTPASATNLPAPKPGQKAFGGEIPAPNPHDPFGEINLSSASPRGAAPSRTPQYEDPFGDLDLPTPAAAADLPAPRHGDPFGAVDLPTPSHAVDLPTPSHAADLPTPSRSIDLPAPSSAEFLPKPKYEDPFGDIELPHSPTSGVPSAAQKKAPAAARREDKQQTRERVQSSGSTDYGEIDLEGGHDKRGSAEFDEFPIAEGQKEEGQAHAESSGIDLAANPHEHIARGSFVDDAPQGGATKDRKTGKFEGRRRYERQSRRGKVLALVVLVVVIAGGGALSATDFGPFGVNVIAELLPNASESKVVKQLASVMDTRLKDDTVAGLDETLRELDVARRDYSDDEDLKLLGVYLYNLRDIRFGHDDAQVRKATELLGKIDLDNSESQFAPLARASRDIVATQAERAATYLASRQGPTPEAIALLAEAQLAAGDGEKALATAKRLGAREKSARTAYLVARALELQGKRKEATAAYDGLAAAYPRHSGGRLSLAALLLKGARGAAPRVLELLDPVTKATSSCKYEKARAFALIGRSQLRSRQPQAAAASFDRAAAIDPENLDLLLGRGFLALANDDVPAATTFFVKARGEDSTSADAKLGHAETMLRLGMFGDAKALVAEVLPRAPDDAYGHYLMGRIDVALKSLEEAEKELKTAIAHDEGLIEAYVALSDLYSKTGRDKEAMDVLETADAEAKGSSVVKLAIADAYAAREDYATAIVALNDAVAIDPNDVRTYFRMAQLYRKLGSAADAQQALDEVVSHDASYPGVDIERGLLLESQGQMADALAAYERALKATPDDPAAKLRVGEASLALRQFDKAEPLLSEAVAAMPASAEANFYMGELFRQTERPVDAEALLRKAVEAAANKAIYHLRLGMAYMATRDMGRATAEIEKARALDPNLAEAPLRAGEVKLRTGGARDAIALFDEALQKDPKLAEAYGLSGEACEELAEFGLALKNYQRAVSELPDDAALNFKLGVTALQVAGSRAALGPLSKAVAIAETPGARAPGAKAPSWLPEAYYSLGVAQQTTGQRAAAVATFKRYLEVAPEKAIDRSEVESRLEQLGATR